MSKIGRHNLTYKKKRKKKVPRQPTYSSSSNSTPDTREPDTLARKSGTGKQKASVNVLRKASSDSRRGHRLGRYSRKFRKILGAREGFPRGDRLPSLGTGRKGCNGYTVRTQISAVRTHTCTWHSCIMQYACTRAFRRRITRNVCLWISDSVHGYEIESLSRNRQTWIFQRRNIEAVVTAVTFFRTAISRRKLEMGCYRVLKKRVWNFGEL